MKYETGQNVIYQDLPAVVRSYAKGWYEVEDENGDVHKARAKELRLEDERSMKDQMKKARARYTKTKNYAGESSMDNGDTVAELLRGLEPHEVMALADSVLEKEPGYHSTKYGHLNRGQQRMNAGNRIRGALRKEAITPDALSDAYKELGLVAMGQ